MRTKSKGRRRPVLELTECTQPPLPKRRRVTKTKLCPSLPTPTPNHSALVQNVQDIPGTSHHVIATNLTETAQSRIHTPKPLPTQLLELSSRTPEQVRQYRQAAYSRYRRKKPLAVAPCIRKKKRNARPKKGRGWLLNIAHSASCLPDVPLCPHCHAMRFTYEVPTFCCSDGKVRLKHSHLPPAIIALLKDNNVDAKQFRACIRTYNNHLAFTSIGVTTDKKLQENFMGIFVFKVQGQVYHFLPSLSPTNKLMSNLQIYFYDSDYEIESRIELCSILNATTLAVLLDVLKRNPYARFFRGLRHLPHLDTKQLYLQGDPPVDQKVYNLPTVDQVSAIFRIDESPDKISKRSVRVFPHSDESRTISYYYGCYDPLQYPLLFPSGEIGWHQGIQKIGDTNTINTMNTTPASSSLINPLAARTVVELLDIESTVMESEKQEEKGRFVSVREYYAYRFQVRSRDTSFLLDFGRLFHQYAVDMYIKLETQRLDFYSITQREIRTEHLQGVTDAISAGETEASNIGQRTILPASFTGGPRHMRRRYMDAMALVRKFGKPDFFLTMTANPNWPEVKKHLRFNQTSQDRPDLVVRVFRAKLEQLKKELLEKHILGEVAAYTYVIEYQKRGLPHAHFLLIMKERHKLYRPEEYDKIVSAELPDPIENPFLFGLIVKHMLHGPCGELNPTNVCMKKKGQCRNGYPKEFCEETTQSSDAYPMYRRRDDKRTVMVRGSLLDNRWVVPHSPYLIALLDCHINVEVCSTVKCVKYIYKYICKGNDKILYRVSGEETDDEINEITDFQSARWISAPEALWRIYKFPLGAIKPPVVRLPLHLENYQTISFNKSQRLQNVLDNTQQQKTMLTEFFFMNRTSKLVEKLKCTYNQFPENFVWHPTKRCWEPRKMGQCVARIVTAHPTEGERYYLRILLTNVRGPTSYSALLIYEGKVASSFHEAALNRGLLKDDDRQQLCMHEAVSFQMPYELRRLFSTILVYSCPNNPTQLWETFEEAMSHDFNRNTELSTQDIRNNVLRQISSFLKDMGKDIHSYGFVDFGFNEEDVNDLMKEIKAEMNLKIPLQDLQSIKQLNHEQTQTFKEIIHRVDRKQPGAFFIDGPGGTGKTFLYKAILAQVRSKGGIAIATASSGIAASILPGGRTAHSRFKIPINLVDGGNCRVSKQSAIGELLKQAKLIIWDEAPMCRKLAIEALDDLQGHFCMLPPGVLFSFKISFTPETQQSWNVPVIY